MRWRKILVWSAYLVMRMLVRNRGNEAALSFDGRRHFDLHSMESTHCLQFYQVSNQIRHRLMPRDTHSHCLSPDETYDFRFLFQMTVCRKTGWLRLTPCINWKQVLWILTPAEKVKPVTLGAEKKHQSFRRKATTIPDHRLQKAHPRKDLATEKSIHLYMNWTKKGKFDELGSSWKLGPPRKITPPALFIWKQLLQGTGIIFLIQWQLLLFGLGSLSHFIHRNVQRWQWS